MAVCFVVLKAFPYAHDHHHVRLLAAGECLEIDDGVVDGLIDEKLIREATAEEAEAAQEGAVVLSAPVEIPTAWEKLPGPKLARLAAALNGGPVAGKAAQLAVIQTEVARRAGA